jgi:hypothetical protein
MKERFVTNLRTYVGVDGIGNYMYENTKVVKFTNYNLLSDTESFVYNVLLQYIPFKDESELFSMENTCHLYILEYKLQGLFDDIDSLLHYVQEYSQIQSPG